MQNSPHLPDWTLDLLAEDALSHAERAAAEAHLRECARCAAELEASRSVISALDRLPRFAPSPGFEEAVMARVVPLPARAAAPARSRRWLPRTRRGWMMLGGSLLVPLAPLAALLAWLLAGPKAAAGTAWGRAGAWVGETAWSALAAGAELVARSGAAGWIGDQAARMAAAPLATTLLLLAVVAAIPLSGWTLHRLLRTPGERMIHA